MSLFFLKCFLKRHDVDCSSAILAMIKTTAHFSVNFTYGIYCIIMIKIMSWTIAPITCALSEFYSTFTTIYFIYIYITSLSENVELWLFPIKASAEVALPATERNMSHKRGKPSSEVPMSSGASAMRPPCKGELFTYFSLVRLLFSVGLNSTRIG